MLFLSSVSLLLIQILPLGITENVTRLCYLSEINEKCQTKPGFSRFAQITSLALGQEANMRVFQDLQEFNYLAKYVNEGDSKDKICTIQKSGAMAEATRICDTHYRNQKDKCLQCAEDYIKVFPKKDCALFKMEANDTCKDFKRVSGYCANYKALYYVRTWGYEAQSIAYELNNFAEDGALRVCKANYKNSMTQQSCKDCRYKLYGNMEQRRVADGVVTYDPTKAKTACKNKFKSIRFTSCVLLRARLWSKISYKPIGDCTFLERDEAFKQAYDVCYGKLPRNHRSECYKNGQIILDIIDEQSKFECETYLNNDCPY